MSARDPALPHSLVSDLTSVDAPFEYEADTKFNRLQGYGTLQLQRLKLRHHVFKHCTGLELCKPSPQLRPGLYRKPFNISMRKLADEWQDGHVCQAGLRAAKPNLPALA